MSNQITGRVVYVGPTLDVGRTNSFLVRTMIIVIGEDRGYPEYLRMDAQRENTSRLDSIKANDIVRATFFLKGQSEIKLDKNNSPSALTSPIISTIDKIGEDPTGPIPDIVNPRNQSPQPMTNQGSSNTQWVNHQHAQQQQQFNQGYNAGPNQAPQGQQWAQPANPSMPQQNVDPQGQPQQEQQPPVGTIPQKPPF